MRTLVIGARGQLGTEVVRLGRLRGDVIEAGAGTEILEHIETDIPIFDKQILPQVDLVVNCAAMHRVDACEEDPEKAFQVNAFAHRDLLRHPHLLAARFVYVSTNYVFSGCTYKRDDDPPDPCTAYGYSKALGEHFTRRAGQTVLRVANLYGHKSPNSKGPNLIRKIVESIRSDDESISYSQKTLSLTSATDAARAVFEGAKLGPGTFNFCNTDHASPHELFEHVSQVLKIEKRMVGYDEKDLFAPLIPSSCFAHINRPALEAVDDFLREAGEI